MGSGRACVCILIIAALIPCTVVSIQITGYGHSDVYHGDNEYCSLSCMQNAMRILSRVLDKFNQ